MCLHVRSYQINVGKIGYVKQLKGGGGVSLFFMTYRFIIGLKCNFKYAKCHYWYTDDIPSLVY